MAIEGVIAERTRGILPVTWDALLGDPRYGESLLQSVINLAKETVAGQVVTPVAESAYPLIVQDYIAKVAALELINPGIDFWMNELLSETATGTSEVHTFADRADKLSELRKSLFEETRRRAAEIATIIGFARPSRRVPLSNTIDDEFLTPSPQEFPRPFRVTERS